MFCWRERWKGCLTYFILSPVFLPSLSKGKVMVVNCLHILPFLPNYKISSDYLFIRIRVLSTKVISLFLRFINNLSFRISKFIATFSTFIFWFLSVSNRNPNTFTFWTNFKKILTHLKKSIMRSFNKFIFFFYQNSIPNFGIFNLLIKKSVWEVISN